MNTPLFLELRKTRSKSAHFKYLYQVILNEEVIVEKRSRKDFVACYITVKDTKFKVVEGKTFQKHIFEAPFYFTKLDVIGNTRSSKTNPYALALAFETLLNLARGYREIFQYIRFNNDL